MFNYDVLCVGSATVDNFLTTEHLLSNIRLGDKILVKSLDRHSGGGATNAAAALSKMGLKVKMLSKLGQDHDAEFVLREMSQYKVKNICLHRSSKNTDFAVAVYSQKEKDRLLFVHKGASIDLTLNDFKISELNTEWIYLSGLIKKSFAVANRLAEISEKRGIKLLFNPSLYLAEKGRKALSKILLATEILILNLEEAQALLKKKSKEPKFLLKELHQCGPETVIITNGNKPLYALHEDVIYSLTPPKVKVVQTTGAGDAFNSGLLAGIIKNYDFEEALKLGQVNALSIIQAVGTKIKLLNEKEAQELIKKYKIKVSKKRLRL